MLTMILEKAYNNILRCSVLRTIFKIHSHKMRSQSPVGNFVDFVKDKVDKVETR